MSKFFGVLVMVIFVQYVIAKNPCDPLEDLKKVDMSVLEDVFNAAENELLDGVYVLKFGVEAYDKAVKEKPDDTEGKDMAKYYFLQLTSVVYKDATDGYQKIRALIQQKDNELPKECAKLPE